MADSWYEDAERLFRIRVPEGWAVRHDPEEAGVELHDPEESGVLHLMGFSQEGEEPADPAEELYSFLEEQGIELQEDEVEDLELAGGAEMAVCEFLSEEEDPANEEEAEDPTHWLVGVATTPGVLVFATYSCSADEAEKQLPIVRTALGSLRLQDAEP
ncbi:hypothetical protein BH24GEM3_BH24GEM3_16550 [soil metagenome]